MKNTRLRPANKQSEKRESWMLLLLSLWLFFQCLFHGRDDQRGKKKHHEPLALSLSVCWRERMTSLCASDVMPRFPKKRRREKKIQNTQRQLILTIRERAWGVKEWRLSAPSGAHQCRIQIGALLTSLASSTIYLSFIFFFISVCRS